MLGPAGQASELPDFNGTSASYSYDNALRLVQVLSQKGTTTISQHRRGLKSGGTAWGWGDNVYGELGDGTTTNRLTPVQTLNLSGVTAIGAGLFHCLAAKSDGSAWAWGWNSYGQLGDGTTTNSTVPIQVTAVNNLTAVAGGGWHSLAVARVQASPTATTTYGYDALDRLTSVNSGATTYSYDPVGNRLTKNATSYTYDRADRILSVGSVTYTVDANGNLTTRGSDTFAYDQANRLTSATAGGTTSTYVYDGDGKQTARTVGTNPTVNYVYDVNGSLPVILTDGTFKYVYGIGLTYCVDTSGNVQVYHTDGLGSVRAITDGSRNVAQTYQSGTFVMALLNWRWRGYCTIRQCAVQ